MNEHICDPTTQPCACGRRWEFVRIDAQGARLYTSAIVRDRYLALYGEPKVAFMPAEEGLC